ncbi:hypothetical protein OS493_018502 [Desmophyllum pertusum]|uniref:Uncharacterized protein n=1 Tax=Desmophyllum pertusum TaxID=174260 RepID=A0A9X0D973_9CNID|nr:hypothetical protein OS493_018502 [Desmophyllum pertusum]
MKTLLNAEEVRMWIEHLTLGQERRKNGAKKAAETRRKKQKRNNPMNTLFQQRTVNPQ